jgi:type I restriction-modification system DNA methylase subunit
MSKFVEAVLSLENSHAGGAPEDISSLVAQFRSLDRALLSQQKEATTRLEFIDPLLRLLGWDVGNRSNRPPSKQEVIVEGRERIDGSLKAPDYTLSIDGKRKLFVEAKKPAEHLETNRNHAYQLRRYSWSAGLSFGVLTDFEEFAIYDCSFAPNESDAADVARLLYFRVDQLEEHWPVVSSFMNRESVANGSLEQLREKTSLGSGEKTIDQSFLSTMKNWRKHLAQDIANLNPELSADRIDYETQTLLNKTIFLRILEDRGFEYSGTLLKISERELDATSQLAAYFKRANDKYNSGLFSGHGLSSQSLADKGISLLLTDRVAVDFLKALYFPNPFEFSVMPVDVLGRIYELMLGEEVTFPDPATRSVEVKLKPEVRKKGGVFYTPAPIVDYIVEQTVGPLVEAKTLASIKKVKIVDPAVGSGSFLVSVLKKLIDTATDDLVAKNDVKQLETGLDGQLRLKTQVRKELLTNCVFGVDIDAQAVEVCKLSLLLLIVENDPQLQFDFGHILPNLDQNILCGNSLISPDSDVALVQEEFDSELNPFDWKKSFENVFREGGFDAVVGNPPYLNIDAIWGKKDKRLGFLKRAYPHIYTDKTDLLYYFLEKGVEICKGELGFIVSRSFLEADKARNLRTWLAKNVRIREVLDFRDALVFPSVGINTLIIRSTKSLAVKHTKFRRWKSKELPIGYDSSTLRRSGLFDEISVPAKDLSGEIWNFGNASEQAVIEKMDKHDMGWDSFAAVGKGMESGANKSFEVPTEIISEELIRSEFIKTRVQNSRIGRFEIRRSNSAMIYPESAKSFSDLPKELQAILSTNRSELEERAAFKRGDCEWWKFTFPLHKEYFQNRKIVSPYMGAQTTFALDDSATGIYLTDTTVIYLKDPSFPANALVALLNSDIANFRFEHLTKLKGGGQREYFAKQVTRFPIPFVSGDNGNIQKLEILGAELARVSAERSSTLIASEAASLTDEIDKLRLQVETLVQGIYGLSDSDVAIIQSWKSRN